MMVLMDPVLSPKQAGELLTWLMTGALMLLTLTVVCALQPPEVTVTVYAPAARLVAAAPDCPLLHWYCTAAVLPETTVLAVPSFCEQVADVVVALTERGTAG